MLTLDPDYAPGYINLGTIHFHLRQFARAEELYRTATHKDPSYVLAFFDLGNVLDELERPDESIAAYQRAVELAPRYADAHYNLALAFERKGEDGRHCGIGRPTPDLISAAPGPSMPWDRSESSSKPRSSASPRVQQSTWLRARVKPLCT